MKSVSAINLAITENMECLIVKVHASFISFKSGCVTSSWCITTLYFTSGFLNMLGKISSEE